ncbi:hypothetical protein Q8A73_004113 [Channa argus]|nr:hypothetical protein Q8A73_004113 [Channa argus]
MSTHTGRQVNTQAACSQKSQLPSHFCGLVTFLRDFSQIEQFVALKLTCESLPVETHFNDTPTPGPVSPSPCQSAHAALLPFSLPSPPLRLLPPHQPTSSTLCALKKQLFSSKFLFGREKKRKEGGTTEATAGVFAQAPWLVESYFVSVEKVWDGMSGLCLTEHVCACVGGEVWTAQTAIGALLPANVPEWKSAAFICIHCCNLKKTTSDAEADALKGERTSASRFTVAARSREREKWFRLAND